MGELVELDVTTLEESVTVNVTEEGSVQINVVAEKGDTGPTGPAGPAGPNSVTSATTSDGTANLSVSNLTTATATVSGTLTANHIHGNIAGSVYAHVRAGENLAKGDPVYISGSHGSGASLIAIVSKADASDPLKMPAVGVMDAVVTANNNGHMVITGTITDLDTDDYAVNAELYVASGGGFTATPPTTLCQPVARVERSNQNNGAVIVKVNGLSTSNGYDYPKNLLRTDATGQLTVGNLLVKTASTLAFIEVTSDSYPDHAAALAINGAGTTYLYLGTSATAGGQIFAQNLTDFRDYQLPNASGTLALTSDLPTLGTNVATFLATPTSANLAAAVTGETGTGALVFGTSPILISPTARGLGTTTGTAFAVQNSASTTRAIIRDDGSYGVNGYVPSSHVPTVGYAGIWLDSSNCGILGETTSGVKGINVTANATRSAGAWTQQDTSRNSFMLTLGYEASNNGLNLLRAAAGSGNTFSSLLNINTNGTCTVNSTLSTAAGLVVTGPTSSIDTVRIQGTTSSSYSSIGLIDNGGTQRGSFGYGGSTAGSYASTVFFNSGTGIPMTFGTNAVERMRLTATGDLGIGTTSPNAAALLQVDSTTKGFLPPRMTTAQRDAISSPPAGLMVYNTTLNKLNFYNGTTWETVTSL